MSAVVINLFERRMLAPNRPHPFAEALARRYEEREEIRRQVSAWCRHAKNNGRLSADQIAYCIGLALAAHRRGHCLEAAVSIGQARATRLVLGGGDDNRPRAA